MARSSPPLCGDFYESALPEAGPVAFLILSEDLWNERVSDSVTVPIYESAEAPTRLRPLLREGLVADCTKVQHFPHEFLGPRLGTCPRDPWTRIRMGVRIHLDIDGRIRQSTSAAIEVTREEWWPHQNEIRFAEFPGIPQAKLFGVVSNDQWNSRVTTTYCSAVRLTSKSKDWRKRWEVDVTGGWVVSADIYSLPYEDMEQAAPPEPYPGRLSLDESAEIAKKQKETLTLK